MGKDRRSLGAGRSRKRGQEEKEKRMNGIWNMVGLTGDMEHGPAARGRSLGV